MTGMFIALGINSFIIITGRMQQRNTAEYVAMTILHRQQTAPNDPDEKKIAAGIEVGKQKAIGLKEGYLVNEGDLVLGENVEFGTWAYSPNEGASVFTPESESPGRTAVRITLTAKQGTILMMALGLFGMTDHPLFRSTIVAAYQPSVNPNHQRYFIVR